MDAMEAILSRRSIRRYTGQKVPEKLIKELLEAAMSAPSASNQQPWQFVIIDDPDIVKQINGMPNANQALAEAPAMIACIVNREPVEVYHGLAFEVEDCSAAVENMLLAITALGYATVWIDGWLRVDGRADAIGKLIGLPAEKAIRIILPVGVPVESWEQKEKLPFEDRAFFNRYGG